MYSRESIAMMDNGAEKKGNEVDETTDDVKIYIRHNAGGIVKDFYQKFKIEKESKKFQGDIAKYV